MLIKKGMQVRVISGAEKGSEGKVLFVSPKKKTVVVDCWCGLWNRIAPRVPWCHGKVALGGRLCFH